ncbi:MarR family winged helix-turn-helix transcriptional regulator [Yoonia sp. F2084L]|uniref:MarR family winged helix-turn-helix transcriptional regulator n=1 Tax=Yoonia sp. F2084L TaxID=2926419 RepID=UPI001FF1C377|nr:MarR family winged helix-turn-helix transcriptional regulator [Yoonia sp. F2084L]MCK0097670.1 MarR family winged helix-turn-helix transcriptional regulator [Yoonia sp. F2084L]
MTQIELKDHRREESFGYLIQTIARTLDGKMKVELEKIGVDIKIFANLMMLGQQDGINQREIGQRLNFPEYFTSRNVDALVEAGLAERRPDPNSRRSFLVFLTDQGRAKAGELPAIVKDVNDDVLRDLDNKDRSTVMALLQKVAGVAST